MVFIDYRQVLVFFVPASLILLGAFSYMAFRHKTGSAAWKIARFTMIACGSLGIFLLLAVSCVAGFTRISRSTPVFSDDHHYAARVTDFDAGGIGGDTSVTVYGDHGFKNVVVLFGGWKIVEAKDVHWLSNSELLIEFPTDTGYGPPVCESFEEVKVTCRPTDRRTWHH